MSDEMEAAWTKEPWRVGLKKEFATYQANTIFSGEDAVCSVYGVAVNSPLEKERLSPHAAHGLANASRIVACVNACAGIPTADLPSLTASLERERELRAALEQLIYGTKLTILKFGTPGATLALETAQAALAKTGGG